MARVLITGAGQVGTMMAREFAAMGYNIVFLDVQSPPWAKSVDYIQAISNKIIYVTGSALDFNCILDVAKKYEVEGLIHTALVRRTPFKEGQFRNIEMTENTLEVARRFDLKLINISSIATYGSAVSSGVVPITQRLTEEDSVNRFPMAPRGPYDTSAGWYSCIKRMGEELVTWHFQTYGMHCCSFRLGSVYGPGDRKLHSLPILLRLAIAGKPFRLPYGGDHPENCTFGRDIGRAGIEVFRTKRLKRSVYNITGVGDDINNYLTTSQIAESVKKVIPTADIKFGSGMYPGGMYGISYVRPPISSERAEQEIHYQITPFEDGVSECAEWTRKNWDLVPRNYFNLAPTWLAK